MEKLIKILAALQKLHGDSACWPWPGYRSPSGYGLTCLEGKQMAAHAASWIAAMGPIGREESGRRLSVCHICDNKPCVNPRHLFVATHRGNILDAVEKGRMRGVPMAAREEMLKQISGLPKKLSRQDGRLSEIARRYGISRQRVHQIRNFGLDKPSGSVYRMGRFG